MDRDDYISNGELFLVLKMMVGNNLKDGQLQQIVDKTIMEADKDGDGKLSFEEFVQMVSNTVRRSPICVRGRLLITRIRIPGYCQANDIGGLVLGWFPRLFHIRSLWSCCLVFGCHVCYPSHPILAITITSLAYCRVYYCLYQPSYIIHERKRYPQVIASAHLRLQIASRKLCLSREVTDPIIRHWLYWWDPQWWYLDSPNCWI